MEESIWFDQHDFEEAEAVYQLYLVRKDTALGHTSATRADIDKDWKGSAQEPLETTKERVIQLVSTLGVVHLNEFEALYLQFFSAEYFCPDGQKHSLKKCLKRHFPCMVLSGPNVDKKIRLRSLFGNQAVIDKDAISSAEELLETTKQRVIQLVSALGVVYLKEFEAFYKVYFSAEYVCPLGQKHCLRVCLKHHFIQNIFFSGPKDDRKIHLKGSKILQAGSTIHQPSSNQEGSATTDMDESINIRRQRVLQLLSIQLNQTVDLKRFKSLYKEYFGADYVCPVGNNHTFRSCLLKHFSGDIRIIWKNREESIQLIPGKVATSGWKSIAPQQPAHNSGNNAMDTPNEFPTLAAASLQPIAKHNSKGFGPPKGPKVNFGQYLNDSGTTSSPQQYAGRVPASRDPMQAPMAYTNAAKAIYPPPQPVAVHHTFTNLPHQEIQLAYHKNDSVQISSNGKSATYEFDVEGPPGNAIPTMDEINERVNHYRTSISNEGHYVDIYSLCKRLCEFYKVRSVRELRCKDRHQGIFRETDITAIREFSMTANKVLCIIQGYCTSSTIATLYDLEKFICAVENKQSFSDIRMGPLQKFPLVWYYFKFPHDMQIKKLTPADIFKYLWEYGGTQGKGKKIDLGNFLEYIAERTGAASPYELGVSIKSIALAISIVRKTKFGDMQKVKEAGRKLEDDMRADIDDYLRKIQRGLTGKNQRAIPGQPENVMQKIAGMHVEDCIIEIFTFAQNITSKLQRQITLQSFFHGAGRIIESMMFFRSKPVLAKFFHVIVATCTFRRIGYDDYQLLELLGFKESLRKITDEQLVDRFGGSDQRTASSMRKHISRARVNPGKLVEDVGKWLGKSTKPLNLETLRNIEQKVAQKFNGLCFDDLGVGTFLSFIQQQQNIRACLGKTILVGTEMETHLNEITIIKDDIKCLMKQCGSDKCKNDVIQAIKRQFKGTNKWSNDQILAVCYETPQSADSSDDSNITFIHALDCGVEKSSLTTTDASTSDAKTGMLGYFTKEQAIDCLKSAPLLENLAAWSCWDIVFEPQFGDLKSFITNCQEIHAIETPLKELLRISLDSSPEHLGEAITAKNPQDAAGHLLSIIRANDGLDKSPLIHISNVVKTSLALGINEQNACPVSIERFVLECMQHIPVNFCSSILTKIFLTPLNELLGDDYGRDPVPARILRVCKSTSERSYLHTLGALLSIKEWEEDFKQTCFGRKHDHRRSANYKHDLQQRVEKPDIIIHKEVDDKTTSEDSDEKMNNHNVPAHDKDDIQDKDTDSTCDLEDIDQKNETLSEDIECSDEDSLDAEVEDDEDIEAEEMTNEIEERMNHCKKLIEKIRRDEFGIGEQIGEKERILLEKNNERLCRSLDRLSTELYAKDTHFVLELVQNADDNKYDDELMQEDSNEKPSVAFIVDKDQVSILNNEHGFEDINIKAICDIGKSTKGKHRKGYIGQKGIGFKSVFRVTDCPEIHSNGFHICFNASENKMGYILPTWREEYTDYIDYCPDKCNLQLNWKTQIDLPLKKELMMSDKTRSRFQNIHPSLLLFLNRLQTLIIENKIDEKCIVMKKRKKGKHLVELTQNGLPTTWFVFTKEIKMAARGVDEATDVSLAFPLDDIVNENFKFQALPPQNVHAFLPLRSYGFKFLIQADFEVPSSREDIYRDSQWNQEVLKEIPRLVVEAFLEFRANSADETTPNALFGATKFFNFLPVESEIHGVFKPVARNILQRLQTVECIPVVKGEPDENEADSCAVDWTKPSQVLLGDSLLRKIVTPVELKRYLDLSYMSDVMQKNVNPALLKALGVHAESLDVLLEICMSHLKIITEEKGKAVETVHWIGNWLLCVSQFLEREYDSSNESLKKIRSSVVFPLSNGKIVSLLGDVVFFPFQKHSKMKSKSSDDDYIVQLEEDLNTIDARIYGEMDEIGKLKLDRFLADLGVRNMSPKEVIENHIVPLLKSGKLAEKEHLVVPYLKYIKQQYFIDESNVDIEVLKQNVVIATNHGFVKPTENQIYFTPSYGEAILDLKKNFSCVNWCLLDKIYVKGLSKDKVKSWQQFFRKLGVVDFPKMRKQQISLPRSEAVKSPWTGLKSNWPTTADGIYHIDDLSCPEFETLLESRNIHQLLNLAEELDAKWKSNFSHLSCIPVKDSQGNEVTTTLSSFLIKLKTHAWLPGCKSANEEPALFVPKDLYLRTQEVFSVLQESSQYFPGILVDNSFIDTIEIRKCVQLETVFEKLREWSSDDSFCTSLNHMRTVYHFIEDRMGEVDEAELNIPIIFVPSNKVSPNKSRGKFYERGQVCLYDFSGVMDRRDNLLQNKRILLFKFYPKDILEFFEHDLGIDATPTIRDYVNMACALADDTRLPNADAYGDLMELFSAIGQKCISSDHEQDFKEMTKRSENLWESYTEIKMCVDSKNANFVFENVKDEKIFPTNRDKFASIAEKPLLSDDPTHQTIFENEDNVHFVKLPDMKAISERISGYLTKEQKTTRIKERQRDYGILVFFAACKIDTVSNVVCAPDVNPENIVEGCDKWHQNLSSLLQYIQRYIFAKDKAGYEMHVEQNLPEKLRCLKFFTANDIITVHRMKEREDVNVKRKKNCTIEYMGEKIYFYIARNSLDEEIDIYAEFIKIFAKDNSNYAETLLDLLRIISNNLNRPERIEEEMKRKGIGSLPEDEETWKLKDISKPKPMRQVSQVTLPDHSQAPDTGGMKSWPPRAPEFYASPSLSNHTVDTNTRQPLWDEPAPPESVTSAPRSAPSGPKEQLLKRNEETVVNKRTAINAGDESLAANGAKSQKQAVKETKEKVHKTQTKVTKDQSDVQNEKKPLSNEPMKSKENVMNDSAKNSTQNQTEKISGPKIHSDNRETKEQQGAGTLSSASVKSNNIVKDQGINGGPPNSAENMNVVPRKGTVFQGGKQIKKLECIEMQEPLDKISKHVRELIININDDDTTAVGRIGEEIVFGMLVRKYEKEIQQGIVNVQWLNQNGESGYPYDVLVTLRKSAVESEQRMVEVKATTVIEDKPFEISSQELRCAFDNRPLYDLYRVCGVGKSENLRIKHLPDLAKYLDNQSAQIYIAI